MSLLALLAAASLANPSATWAPKPAPSVHVTPNYALTFRTPARATYCPLPNGWVGSDHGTVLFLVPPERCGGEAGYPSIDRGVSPETPRIEVYYGYWDPDDDDQPSCSNAIGSTLLVGEARPLCQAAMDDELLVTVSAPYRTDGPTLVSLTLVTTPRRFDADLMVLRSLAATVRPCQTSYWIQRKRHTLGTGAPCPPGKWF